MDVNSSANRHIFAHPKYDEMIVEAISALNEKNGSSKFAISKYIMDHYEERALKKQLINSLMDGVLAKHSGIGVSGSFKLSPATKTQLQRSLKKAKKIELSVPVAARKRANAPKKSSTPSAPKKEVKKSVDKRNVNSVVTPKKVENSSAKKTQGMKKGQAMVVRKTSSRAARKT